MSLSILQHTEQRPPQEILWPQMPAVLRLRNLELNQETQLLQARDTILRGRFTHTRDGPGQPCRPSPFL